MSAKRSVEEILKTAKTWNIGSLSKKEITFTNNAGLEESKMVRSIKLNDDIRIFVGDLELDLSKYKDVPLYELIAEKKNPKLLEAEAKFNFEVTHDVSVKLANGDKK